MRYRLPRPATALAPASVPPSGLPGLDPDWSRIVDVVQSALDDGAPGASHAWHLLDNGEELAALGAEPVGTILCVHGNPTWSYLWRDLVAQASAAAAAGSPAWRVIAVDQLDMGFSERTGVARPLSRRVQDLDDLTRTLGLSGPVVTFGHDWGGVVSLGWAVDHPELLAGVLLLNTAIHQSETEPIPAPLRLALARGVLSTGTVITTAFLETTLALGHPALPAEVKNAYRAPYRTPARRGGIGGFVADIPVDAGHESHAELDRIAESLRALTVPALMLWGPRDPIFSDRYLDDLSERMPHAAVHRFEGSGHLIAEDVDYAGAALGWLSESLVEPAPLAEPGPLVESTTQPLWHYLDELRDSDETALIDMAPAGGDGPRVVSWRLLSRRVREIAAGLHQIGVRRGDRVSLLVPPSADLTAVLYACIRLGAIVVVADAGLGLTGLTRAVRGARPDHVIGALPGLMAARALGWPGQKISVNRLPAVSRRALGVSYALADLISLGRDEELPEPPEPGDVAAVLFTSGSTGPAKGVVYTHGQLSAVSRALHAQYGVGRGTGLVAGFAPFALLGPALGARSVTPDMDVTAPKTLTATAVAAAVAAIEATVVFLSPAALANVVATQSELSPADRAALARVTSFLSAGAPVSESLLASAAALMPGASAHTPYGMTEGLLMTDITLDGIREAARDDVARGPGGVCVGSPTATTRVRISALDETGAAVGELSEEPQVTGEIVVSAPHVKDHYDRLWLTDQAATRAVTPGERWHRTGDVGHLDAAGRLWVEGRLPHVITTAEGVITPVGAELAVSDLAGVDRAAAVGVGPAGSQQVVIVVETVPPASRVGLADSALAAAVRAVAGHPIAAVLVVPHLPTDIRHNSKIDRTRLARWANGILTGARLTQP
ncbi:alpha/beta fold hydrolase [Cryobacterium lactosi]|uniref:Alpha/beta fold hydrolase n=1 Tax=Cryobacterium lactosi TaxID=1259202 RepID=A0A4R9BLL2_9MICO|nr:alpha/beta fold hydrolase [Cryobacterium lactosi]TFD86691.1 alpha/beta fold hydrolase [Cryobacterium lactosi]